MLVEKEDGGGETAEAVGYGRREAEIIDLKSRLNARVIYWGEGYMHELFEKSS